MPNTDYLPAEDPEAAVSLSVTNDVHSIVIKPRDALSGVLASTITASGILILMSAMKQIIVGTGTDPLTTFGGFFLNQNTVGLGNNMLAGLGHCQSFGAITEPEDITTKEYVDGKIQYGASAPSALADGCIFLVYE